MGSTVPGIDAGARQRLIARFGSEVEAWFDELPGALTVLAERWQFRLGSAIPRGSVSTVFRLIGPISRRGRTVSTAGRPGQGAKTGAQHFRRAG